MATLRWRQFRCAVVGVTSLLFSLPGCSLDRNDAEEQAAALSKANAEVASSRSEFVELQTEYTRFMSSQLKEKDRRQEEADRKKTEHQQALTSITEKNETLTDQLEELQLELEESEIQLAVAELALEKSESKNAGRKDQPAESEGETTSPVADSGANEKPPGLSVKLAPLPPVTKEDASECEQCNRARHVDCDYENCKAGLVRRRIKRFHKRFPCPMCLGLVIVPCVSCRDKEHDHTLAQSTLIGGHLKRARLVWIEYLSLTREIRLANAQLTRKSSGSSDSARSQAEARRRAAENRIKAVTPKLELVLKKNLRIQQEIVAVFRQQLELCLRSTPKSEQPLLRDKSLKAIEAFVRLYNLGYYY